MTEVKKQSMKVFSKEEIKKAESVDMYEFLIAHGQGELKGGGRYPKYYIKGHNSLVIDRKKNYFYHNSTRRGNNIIKLLTDYEGYPFRNAVSFLLGEEFEQHTEYIEEPFNGVFDNPYEQSSSDQVVRDYLINERKIDREIVDYLIDNGYLYQDTQFKSAIFAWKEFGLPAGNVLGATSQGTRIDFNKHEKRGTGKYIATGVKPHYGFSVTIGQPKAYYFFEAHVDLLSYWSMHKDLTDCRLFCLEGLKENTISEFIQETIQQFDVYPEDGIFYCLDNDAAGHKLFDKAHYYFNIKKDLTGKATENHNRLPYDKQIPSGFHEMYKEAAEKYGTTWELLATVHKVETNFSSKNSIANMFNLHGRFAVPEKEKKEDVNVPEVIETLAAEIQEKNISIDNIMTLYPDYTNYELFAKNRLTTTYQQYMDGEFELTDEVLKDCNDQLKVERLKGLVTESVPLAAKNGEPDYVLNSKKEEFTYYLQDAESKNKIKDQIVGHFGIHPSIVTVLVQKGMIRQDINDRIVYLWNDSGNVIGGQIRGTFFDKKAFGRAGYEQKIMDLSKEGYGFNVTLGKPSKMCFFQTPEDLLSYWSLNIDKLTDTVLFSLSDNEAEHVVDAINHKLSKGMKITEVEMCVGNNQAGMTLLDDMAQLEDFDQTNRTLLTEQGESIALSSARPKIGVDWLAELHAKQERQRRLSQAQGYPQHQTRNHEQQMQYSR